VLNFTIPQGATGATGATGPQGPPGPTGGSNVEFTNSTLGSAAAEAVDTSSGGGFGLFGTSSNGTGVFGKTSGSGGIGVWGQDSSSGSNSFGVDGTSANGTGVVGTTLGTGQNGVWGRDYSSSGTTSSGVYGTSTLGSGVYGSSGTGSGVSGAGNPGVSGTGPTGVSGTGGNVGVAGTSTSGYGVSGTSTNGYGVYGSSGYFAGDVNVAGEILADTVSVSGDVNVTGTLTAVTKHFKIDHPLDPANKYLYHASVESSEMMNIYTGNVITDAQGEATVTLPDWFEALNTDFRYQLTVIGQFAQAIIAHKIANHQFQIKSNAPNVEVSWQVTAVRQDAYARAHPMIAEVEKTGDERGRYLHPVEHGVPKSLGIDENRMAKMHLPKPEMPKPPLRASLPVPPKVEMPDIPKPPAGPILPPTKPRTGQQPVATPEPKK